MKIICPGCSSEYNVDDSRIPPEGMKATCPKCMNSWVVNVGGASPPPPAADSSLLDEAFTAAPVEQAPAPPPPQQQRSAPPPPPPVPAQPSGGGINDDVDWDRDDDDLEPLELNILGRSIELPNVAIMRMLLNPKIMVTLVLGVALVILVMVQFVRFQKDLTTKQASWGEVDFVGIRINDIVDASLPLKDDIKTDGTFADNLKNGVKALNQGTYAGLKTAETSLRKAAKLKRSSALARALLAEVYARLLAITPEKSELERLTNLRIDRALRIDDQLTEAFRAKAELSLSKKDYTQAALDINKAISLDGKDAHNSITRGRIELAKGSTDAAQKAFEKAVQLDSSLAEGHYYLGTVLEKKALYDGAEKELQAALSKSFPDWGLNALNALQSKLFHPMI